MQGVAEFYKVSFNQFLRDSEATGFADSEANHEILKLLWNNIKLPARATTGSAGYDFFLPYPFFLAANKTITIPTGIRADIQPGWALVLAPRSSLGTKYGMHLSNTIGVIDSDYFYANNEGHILASITTDTNMCLSDGDRFIQGIFLPHGVAHSDSTLGQDRTGGFGSTGEK